MARFSLSSWYEISKIYFFIAFCFGFWSKYDYRDILPDIFEQLDIYFYSVGNFNKKITNIPLSVKKIRTNIENYEKYIEKIPFGCVIEKIDIK